MLDRESSLVQILQTKYSKKNGFRLYTSAGNGTVYVYGAGLISQDSDASETALNASKTETDVETEPDATKSNAEAKLNAANVTINPDYLQYHYNNVGSTTMVTNSIGEVKERFQYGTYGELLSANVLCLKFLYNGKYGVTT